MLLVKLYFINLHISHLAQKFLERISIKNIIFEVGEPQLLWQNSRSLKIIKLNHM